ncbi:MAG: NAD(P)/FAD-dependent oxidoreductase [Candidatus Helarchaeota archaeon]
MSESKFDVIIVGAGPAGSIAAKRCAKKGLNVLMIEEHMNIGLPVHCSGWINGCPYTERLINEFGRDKIITEVKKWRVYTPSGEFAYEFDFNGGYFVDRTKLDQFLAKEAIKAGAKLNIRTKFLDLIKENENIKGIIIKQLGETKKIYADIVIGCDGARSIPLGVANKSGILKYDNKKGREYYPGIQIEFLNIKDMEPGVIEIFFGTIFDKNLGSAFVSPLHEGHGLIGFGSYKDYLNVKSKHPIFKERLKDAQEFGMRGGLYAALLGESLKRGAMSGLLLCGDAVGYHGIIPAMISAEIAADVAIDAINSSNTNYEILREYDKLRRKNPIARAKLGISFKDIDEENLNSLLKEQGKQINESLFKNLDKFDYKPKN